MANSCRILSALALLGILALATATESHARRYGRWLPCAGPPIEPGIRQCWGTLCPAQFAFVGISPFSGLPTYTPVYGPYAYARWPIRRVCWPGQ